MFWIIQENFYSESNHSLLVSALDRLDIPYLEVDLFNILSSDGSLIVEKAIACNQKNIIVCGSTQILSYGKVNGWEPAHFLNEKFSYTAWLDGYGNNLLNHDLVIDLLSSVRVPEGKFFIRPLEDNKSFDGKVLNKSEFDSFRNYVLTHKSDVSVVVSSCKTIYAEYRFFVVDGIIISYSQYKSGSSVFSSPDVSSDALNYAKLMIDTWQPARSFVLDIALTADGYSIVEINNITSSGFYSANVAKIVDALDSMVF